MKNIIIGTIAWAALMPSFERGAHAQPQPPTAASPTIYASAYLLLGQPGTGQPAQVCRTGWDGDTICTALAIEREKPLCQLPPAPRQGPPVVHPGGGCGRGCSRGNHISVRWRGTYHPHHWAHHRHHH